MVRHPWRPGIELRPSKLLTSIAEVLDGLGLVFAGIASLGESGAQWSDAGTRLQRAAELLTARSGQIPVSTGPANPDRSDG